MTNCTGKRCPVQVGKVDPTTCEAYKDCQWATRPMTNADRIRAMTDEELAEWGAILSCCPSGSDLEELCYPQNVCENTIFARKCWLNWLKQEADDG